MVTLAELVYPPPARADLDALTEDTHRRDAETKTGDQWAPGSPGIVTAGVRSETFTADVRGASEFVVCIKSNTSGSTADVTVQLV